MRILHIIATLDLHAGGPSNSVRRMIAAYPKIGSEGEAVTLDDPAAPFLREIGFPVHALGPVATRFAFSERLIPWLRKERHRFDGIVVHGLWQYIGYAVRRAIGGHKPYLVFTHGMLDPYFKRAHPLKHLKKFPFWLVNEYWVLRNAHRVLFTSEAEAALATQSFWPCRWSSKVVPYGASAPSGDPTRLAETFLKAFPALRQPDGEGLPFVLFLGRIHSKKGCDLLLDAFIHVATKIPELQLVFAGPDATGPASDLKAKMVAQAAAAGVGHRVHWTGMLDGDLKWGAFCACEVFALHSHQENFGIAVAEALACGKPVLLSDKVNIWEEIVRDGAAFAAADTAAGTLQALKEWIALTPTEKSAMGQRALECFKRRYDTSATAGSIVEIFTQASPIECPPRSS